MQPEGRDVDFLERRALAGRALRPREERLLTGNRQIEMTARRVRGRIRYGCGPAARADGDQCGVLLADAASRRRAWPPGISPTYSSSTTPACYATLTQEDRAARSLKQFLTEIPLAPDVNPIWFRAILLSTRYEVGQPQVSGERAVVPVKVTMPDLPLWERTIDAKAGPQDSLNVAADKSLETGAYPKVELDALVMVDEQHEWRVVADFARRDLIRDGNREAVGIYHSEDYPKAAAAYHALLVQLGQSEFSGSGGIAVFFKRRLMQGMQQIQAQVPAASRLLSQAGAERRRGENVGGARTGDIRPYQQRRRPRGGRGAANG